MTPSSKQRIIGAFVLCGLALIFFPVLFDLSDQKDLDTSEQIPTMPEIEPEVVATPEPIPDIVPPKPEPRAFQPSVEPEQVVNSEPQPPTLDTEGLPDAWVIQAASFSDSAKAQELSENLKADGFKSYVQKVSVPQGTMHRVFVGPKVLKKDALAEQQEIEEKYKLHTILRQFKP